MDNNTSKRKPESITKVLFKLALMGNVMACRQRADLLTNGGRAPIPTRILNQRQKRKRAAQTR